MSSSAYKLKEYLTSPGAKRLLNALSGASLGSFAANKISPDDSKWGNVGAALGAVSGAAVTPSNLATTLLGLGSIGVDFPKIMAMANNMAGINKTAQAIRNHLKQQIILDGPEIKNFTPSNTEQPESDPSKQLEKFVMHNKWINTVDDVLPMLKELASIRREV